MHASRTLAPRPLAVALVIAVMVPALALARRVDTPAGAGVRLAPARSISAFGWLSPKIDTGAFTPPLAGTHSSLVVAPAVHLATLEAGLVPLLTAAVPPATPSGPSPASAATAVAISTSLTWAASAEASTYDVAFGTVSPPPLVSANQSVTSYTPGALAYAKKYYWRITAKGPGGSTVGPVWSFTTIAAPPAVPGTPSPADGASAVATSTLLKWAASTRATSYDVALGASNPPVSFSLT